MPKKTKSIEDATRLANAAMVGIIDVEASRETQLLALSELAYRVQATIDRMEDERKNVRSIAYAPRRERNNSLPASYGSGSVAWGNGVCRSLIK